MAMPHIPEEHAAEDQTFRSSVESVMKLLNYQFGDLSLLESALTHSSGSSLPWYQRHDCQRLEFVGDAALGLAMANFLYITYPGINPSQLSLLRAVNVSNERLARVAVRHGLFQYVRHKSPVLTAKVQEFSIAVLEEGDKILPYGGLVRAPKVLADIVESVAAAIYVDCNFDLKLLWKHFSPLLEPVVRLENLAQQPITTCVQLCQKHGKKVHFEYLKNGGEVITNVFADGELLGSAPSKISAAKEALGKVKLVIPEAMDEEEVHHDIEMSEVLEEIDGAKQKLIALCNKKAPRWPQPTYRVIKDERAPQDRRLKCSVEIETLEGVIETTGVLKSKLKDAEKSAASMMLRLLNESGQQGVVGIPSLGPLYRRIVY